MITINLKGGLGNQMFQYACGRAISLRNSNTLKLDTSGFARIQSAETPRQYALGIFNIDENIASREETQKAKYPFGIISKGWRYVNAKVFRKFNTAFDPKVLKLTGNFYLDGYWQTEKYFSDFAAEIRKDFTLKTAMDTKAEEMKRLIENSLVSVSLHLRRGDYAYDEKTNKVHGVCDAAYYGRAIEKLTAVLGDKSKDIHIFVFSDDIEWAKNNLSFPYPATFVSHPEIKDYEELVLMSKCKHNIIANSSFSWWGAWLNQNSAKIVVTPTRWVNKNEEAYVDIIPKTWIRV